MTRILAECLLSPLSLRLAQRATAVCVLNESEGGEESPTFVLDELEGWKPKFRGDQIILQRFLARPESNQH
jgi:hypothetical protein